MIIIQTFLIYILLYLILYGQSKRSEFNNSLNPILFALSVYSVIFGLRYGVGTDHLSYLEAYNEASNGTVENNIEIGFAMITNTMAKIGVPSFIYFTILAFIPIFLVYKSEENTKVIYRYLSFVFVFGCIWLTYNNGLRQVIAFAIWVYSLQYIIKKKAVIYFILILLAMSFHKSAVILLPIYFIYHFTRKEWFSNVWKQIGCVIIAAVLGQLNFPQRFSAFIDRVLIATGYGAYLDDYYHQMVVKENIENIGLGFIIILLINIANIIHSEKVKLTINDSKITFIYNLYFIGVIVFYLFNSSLIINRINMYFYGFSFIFSAYVLYYLKISGKQIPLITLVAIYILLFVGYLYRMFDNDSAFSFIWQEDLYGLHHPLK